MLNHLTLEQQDPEERDVFQIRLGEQEAVPWPGESMRSAALSPYHLFWEVSRMDAHACAMLFSSRVCLVGVCLMAEEELGLEPNRLVKLCVRDSSAAEPENSSNSNFCLFRYVDEFQYSASQACMVHQDYGMVTIVPRFVRPQERESALWAIPRVY